MSTKNTILKAYDGRFKDIFQEIFDKYGLTGAGAAGGSCPGGAGGRCPGTAAGPGLGWARLTADARPGLAGTTRRSSTS